MKRVLLVNGVPASGKSAVAKAVAEAEGWPLLALDTVKEAFFAHLGTGDREYNRTLGKASYQALFALIADFPSDIVSVIDAWFGFQPEDVLHDHFKRAGITQVGEVWCHAPAKTIGERYRARLGERSNGHLGADYIPELIKLAGSAQPLESFPLFEVDTTRPLELTELQRWLGRVFH